MRLPATDTRQRHRTLLRVAFFALFLLAPAFDLFRFDLNLGHFVTLGHNWTLGLDPFLRGDATPTDAAWNLFWRGLIPIVGVVGGVLCTAWFFGRLYCGWLCPHFSVVEIINSLMRRASGSPTLWERAPADAGRPDGPGIVAYGPHWFALAGTIAAFSCLWALTLLTYIITPSEVYRNILALELTRNQALFLGVGTLIFAAEFTFARHLFCRYGCAIGLFQSFAWMANTRAMVVAFDGSRAKACVDCFAACDDACPMRLKPRAIKRKIFTCTQCSQCISACTKQQARTGNTQDPLLRWVRHQEAIQASGPR